MRRCLDCGVSYFKDFGFKNVNFFLICLNFFKRSIPRYTPIRNLLKLCTLKILDLVDFVVDVFFA